MANKFVPFGEIHGRAKMTNEQVLYAVALRSKGATYQDIADRFGVSKAAVAHIFQGITWKKITQGKK